MDRLMEERIAKNDAAFREANERIRAAAEEHAADGMRIPFICECADPTCKEIVRLWPDEYREVRSHPRRFLNAPGHQAAAMGAGTVVAERDGWVMVEKQGHAGEVAEALADDPAAGDAPASATEQ